MAAIVVAATIAGAAADTVNHIESAWSNLKVPLLDAATKVRSLSDKHQWSPETW